ncbi:hypothetical protein HRbin38_00377 [bacterium HR38]|nr:hypothetical protein HRbin38_00377 [bacterium HR38]
MLSPLRSLGRKFWDLRNTLIDIFFLAFLAALHFPLWLNIFLHVRNGWFGAGDVFVAACLFWASWGAFKRFGVPYGSALLGAMVAAYFQSSR